MSIDLRERMQVVRINNSVNIIVCGVGVIENYILFYLGYGSHDIF